MSSLALVISCVLAASDGGSTTAEQRARALALYKQKQYAEACALFEQLVGHRALPHPAGHPEHLDAEAGLPLEGPTEAAAASPAPAAPDRATLEATLAAHGGNGSAAARALGPHRTQVYRLMQRWGLGTP